MLYLVEFYNRSLSCHHYALMGLVNKRSQLLSHFVMLQNLCVQSPEKWGNYADWHVVGIAKRGVDESFFVSRELEDLLRRESANLEVR